MFYILSFFCDFALPIVDLCGLWGVRPPPAYGPDTIHVSSDNVNTRIILLEVRSFLNGPLHPPSKKNSQKVYWIQLRQLYFHCLPNKGSTIFKWLKFLRGGGGFVQRTNFFLQ